MIPNNPNIFPIYSLYIPYKVPIHTGYHLGDLYLFELWIVLVSHSLKATELPASFVGHEVDEVEPAPAVYLGEASSHANSH